MRFGNIVLMLFIVSLLGSSFYGCIKKPKLPESRMSVLDELKEPVDLITTFKLDNGLEVLIIEKHQVPIVTILAAVNNGAMTETEEYNGLSHLYEHMFFKGNVALPNQSEYLKRTRELGMSFNGTTSFETVDYYFTLPIENLEDGLVFMKNALMSPLFNEDELEKEKLTVLSEFDRNESHPGFFLGKEMSAKLFYKHPTRKDIIGSREVIKTATREKMLTIKNRYYVPNNTLLVISGDVDPEAIKPIIEKTYLTWPRAKDPFDLYPVPEHPPLTQNEEVIVQKPYQNVTIKYNWHGPSVDKDPKATYAADVFSFIVNQRASKLNKKLVDTGITLGVGLGYHTLSNTGTISMHGMATPEKATEAIKAMQAELTELVKPDYYTDAEMENAKLMLAIEGLRNWEGSEQITKSFGFWWCVADLDYRLNYMSNLSKVTRDDISSYLQKYIIGKYYVKGVLVSPENFKLVFPEKAPVDDKEVAVKEVVK